MRSLPSLPAGPAAGEEEEDEEEEEEQRKSRRCSFFWRFGHRFAYPPVVREADAERKNTLLVLFALKMSFMDLVTKIG